MISIEPTRVNRRTSHLTELMLNLLFEGLTCAVAVQQKTPLVYTQICLKTVFESYIGLSVDVLVTSMYATRRLQLCAGVSEVFVITTWLVASSGGFSSRAFMYLYGVDTHTATLAALYFIPARWITSKSNFYRQRHQWGW